jgi:5-guanidino-2-oxopentanoate decarboxylase
MVSKGIQPNAVTLRNPDFAALARSYGCEAMQPQSLAQLAEDIARGLKADGPVLIEVRPSIAQ